MCRGERPVLDGLNTHTYGFRSDFVGFFNRLTLYDRLTSLLHPVSEELAVDDSEADQSSLTITNIPETGSGNLDTFFICFAAMPRTPSTKNGGA